MGVRKRRMFDLIERRAMPPLGHFSLIRFGKIARDCCDEHQSRRSRPPATRYRSLSICNAAATTRTFRGLTNGQLLRRAQDAALGRPPLLSPQPDQSVAAPGQRDFVPVRLRAGIHRSGPGRADRLAGGDDDAAGRPLLLRAEGLRPHQPGHARAQGRDQGRLQSPAQGRAADDLGAVAALRSTSIRRCSASSSRTRPRGNSSGTSR